ncbi:MBL fold metallo-hydrolase RNA specificity domain-containing protein [Polymorphum gilvum]|uniref:Beta-lactamase domain protein n=1 Tax=Polymorphum gilvum (strain LMG 25793 / CGMCC 1.9160 / SL003B-26A1) TaxID=991905 RepID=F2J551_POLGS|nr:MBL fold metallo-hydrolase [Polymorphum gilvum]ADZ71110.1 Beta-lactamase domain protein [Polymorphum gilvum SL003B-26A1]
MAVRLTFCGAARMVTGSCYLLDIGATRLLVDCGLFQGSKTVKELNYRPFPFAADSIDVVLLTHAHIDHAGLVPKLWRAGFRGPVHMTEGTRDLLSFMLPDSGHIQQYEVENLNRRNLRRGKQTVTPIYTQADAYACQETFQAHDYDVWVDVAPGVRARFWNAGHILGSASVELEIAPSQAGADEPLRLLFSGDIGPEHKAFHPDPEAASGIDHLICESTYGGREREHVTDEQRRLVLAREVRSALDSGGVLLIPAFAVERTQELIFDLMTLMESGGLNRVPVFLDSPLAIKATETFNAHADDLEHLSDRPHLLDNRWISYSETVEDSKALNRIGGGAIIIAASGMCDAGRIRHHLKNRLWRPNTTVLLVGYQAPATLGAILRDGAQSVRIMGEEVKVRADIRSIDVYSGHAARDDLLDWVEERKPVRGSIFLTHGEESQSVAMRDALVGHGFAADNVVIPDLDAVYDLLPGRAIQRRDAAPPRAMPDIAERRDWHNDYAELILDIQAQVDAAADERARAVLIRRLRRALEERE